MDLINYIAFKKQQIKLKLQKKLESCAYQRAATMSNGHNHDPNYVGIHCIIYDLFMKETSCDKLRYFLGRLCTVIKPKSEIIYGN